MGFLFSLIAIIVLIIIGYIGGSVEGLHYVFSIVIPYAAIAIFIFGLIYRVVKWARSPVPFRITTTCGQQESLDFIKQNKFDNPSNGFQACIRMALEILTFRTLFRNTQTAIKEGPKLTYSTNLWLWAFSMAFHWSFLIIILRHFRLFTDPVPFFVPLLEGLDGFFQIGVPVLYITSVLILAGLVFLLLRRLYDNKVRYISLASDYFPLFLIISIAASGVWMRYFDKVNLPAIKNLTMGLFSFQPIVPEGIEPFFFLHLFLVSVLLIYFPMSKLVHMPGIFLSPTRNLANNNRKKRHINPWNPDVAFHTYEEYEEEFHDVMKEAGLPLEKEYSDVN